jgi:hypothetical protein
MRAARHRRDCLAECGLEARLSPPRIGDDQRAERDACSAALASGYLGGALLRRRPKLATAPVLAEARQRLDSGREDVVLVVELDRQSAAGPAAAKRRRSECLLYTARRPRRCLILSPPQEGIRKSLDLAGEQDFISNPQTATPLAKAESTGVGIVERGSAYRIGV